MQYNSIMRGVWPEISEEDIISDHFMQGKKNSFLVFYTPVSDGAPWETCSHGAPWETYSDSALWEPTSF